MQVQLNEEARSRLLSDCARNASAHSGSLLGERIRLMQIILKRLVDRRGPILHNLDSLHEKEFKVFSITFYAIIAYFKTSSRYEHCYGIIFFHCCYRIRFFLS